MSCIVCSRRAAQATRRSVMPLLMMGPAALKLLANTANGDPRLERLFQSFIAPCCWRENLLVHHSPLADELRAEIRKDAAAGKSDEQIKAALVARYTTRILAMPEGAQGQWLSWTPWALATAGLAALAAFVYRSTHQPPAPAPTGPLPDLPEDEFEWRKTG